MNCGSNMQDIGTSDTTARKHATECKPLTRLTMQAGVSSFFSRIGVPHMGFLHCNQYMSHKIHGQKVLDIHRKFVAPIHRRVKKHRTDKHFSLHSKINCQAKCQAQIFTATARWLTKMPKDDLFGITKCHSEIFELQLKINNAVVLVHCVMFNCCYIRNLWILPLRGSTREKSQEIMQNAQIHGKWQNSRLPWFLQILYFHAALIIARFS